MRVLLPLCLLALILLALPPARAQDGDNPCREGFYLDYALDTPSCRPRLQPERGFDWEAFNAEVPDQTFPVSECSYAGLRASLDRAGEAGGGRVDLSACGEVRMEGRIRMPDHTILEGAGPGRTVLKPPADLIRTTGRDSIGQLVTVFNARNVVLRGLTLDGGGVSFLVVAVAFSDNVLLERVELAGGLNNGIDFTHSSRVEVRYAEVHGTKFYNGISSKDCYPNRSSGRYTLFDCVSDRMAWARSYEELDGTLGRGTFFSSNYAVYSNVLYDNSDHCLALHARQGEVAGNLCRPVLSGFKFPDAQDVYVHHNRIEDGRRWGIHIYPPTLGLYPQRLYVFQNRIRGNGWEGIRVNGAQVSLFYNELQGNVTCIDRCPGGGEPFEEEVDIGGEVFPDGSGVLPSVQICRGSREEEIGEAGKMQLAAVQYAPESDCLFYGSFPLELTAFTAKPGRESVVLRWLTEREYQNDGFTVELSYEGGAFEKVAFVEGAGRSVGPHAYLHHVERLRPGAYAFRLRQRDREGAEVVTPSVEAVVADGPTYSPTEGEGLPDDGLRVASLYPNPFGDRLTVDLRTSRSEHVAVELFDVLGRSRGLLWEGTPPAGSTSLDLSVDGLDPGVYWLRVRGEERVVTRSVVRR